MHFLITAGGTREYVDPVRFISNASSGKMGYALAAAAKEAGHKVTLISASDLQPAVGVEFIGVDSAAEMFEAVKRNFASCDCLIMAAAVSDYTPVKPANRKIERAGKTITIKLKPTADILKWAGQNRRSAPGPRGMGQLVIGFALEDRDLRQRAERKLAEKNLDMIIANTPAAIGSDKTSVQIKTPDGKWLRLSAAAKSSIASRIIKLIEKRKF